MDTMQLPAANPRIAPRTSFALAHEAGHRLLASREAFSELIDNSMEAHVKQSRTLHFSGHGTQDYSNVNGHERRVSPTATPGADTPTPQVSDAGGAATTEGGAGSESGGGDGGGSGGGGADGSGEDGGDGDGEPPIPAGLASGGDGQHNFLSLLLLIYVCFDKAFRLVLSLPILAALAVYHCVPSLPSFWLAFRYTLPPRLRRGVWMPHVWTMFRDRHKAKHKPLRARLTIGLLLRVSTILLVLRVTWEGIKLLWEWKDGLPEL